MELFRTYLWKVKTTRHTRSYRHGSKNVNATWTKLVRVGGKGNDNGGLLRQFCSKTAIGHLAQGHGALHQLNKSGELVRRCCGAARSCDVFLSILLEGFVMKLLVRSLTCVALVTALLASASTARADEPETFSICVRHNINGRALGLSKELPVTAFVTVPSGEEVPIRLEFKGTFKRDLPAGVYSIRVVSDEAGPLPSMSVDPVDIPAGADVFILARLGARKMPVLDVKLR
jgi:hypothetical protein